VYPQQKSILIHHLISSTPLTVTRFAIVLFNIGKVVFMCVTGSNTLKVHITNPVVGATRIVPGVDCGNAPAGFTVEARDLGVSLVVRSMINQADKVVICGHSRGGSIAHIAHYDLIVNSSYSLKGESKAKIISVAFGSPPFLRSNEPNLEYESKFLNFFNEKDIIPSLFMHHTKLAEKLKKSYKKGMGVLGVMLGFSINQVFSDLCGSIGDILNEYNFYGTWTMISDLQIKIPKNTMFK